MNKFEKLCSDVETRKANVGPVSQFLGMVTAVIVAYAFLIFEAFVISTLWNWFLIPVTGITMTLVAAMSISLIAGILTYQPRKRTVYETMWGMYQVLKVNFLALVMGWAILAALHLKV